MSFKTLWTSIVHWFTKPTVPTKITQLISAAHADYDAITAKASADLVAVETRVETIAKDELAAIRHATGAALRRAEALLGTGALTGAHGEVIEVLAKGLDGAANLIDPTVVAAQVAAKAATPSYGASVEVAPKAGK